MPLVEESAHIAAVEAAAIGIDQAYSPMVDISRDPRWGRVAESPGEDPFLAARFAEAMVRGYQGKDLKASDAVMACLKHYVGYGAGMGGRDYDAVDLSPASLHDVYLAPFAAGVRAGAGSVMAAFHTLNGVPMHANRDLIADVLRRGLGFDGLVVADYTGILELVAHGVAADKAGAAPAGHRGRRRFRHGGRGLSRHAGGGRRRRAGRRRRDRRRLPPGARSQGTPRPSRQSVHTGSTGAALRCRS